MRKFYKLLLAILMFNTTVGAIFSQTMVSGVVKDSIGGAPLPFSTVTLKGTTTGTTTDLNGEYRIPLSPGTYTLVASFMGYKSQETKVTVQDAQSITVDFNLASASIMGDEVVVTAMWRGQKAAISSQLNAAGIVNAVSEEQIQELPDANAGDALGRLPGISLKRSGGEAQNIVLRGLNEKFSMIQLNGVPVPSTDGETRGVDLSMFSLSSLAGIEVTKALTPDMDADAIAGAVNMVTKKAAPDPQLRIDLGGGYNKLENSAAQYNAAVRYSRRVFKDFLGVQASVNSERKIRSNEKYTQSWNIQYYKDNPRLTDFTLSYTDEIRKRVGGSLLLDFNTPDKGTIRFNNFYNRSTRDAVNYERDYNLTSSYVYYKIHDTERDIHTINNALSGENYLGKVKINWGASHALTIGNTGYDHQMEFEEGGTDASGIKRFPDDVYFGPGERIIPFGYDNYREAFLNVAYFEPSKSKDRDLIGYFDVERKLTISDKINLSFKAGGKYRGKNRSNVDDVYWAPYWVSQPKKYSQLADGSIVDADYSHTSFADLIMVGGTTVSMLNFLEDNPPSRDLFDGQYNLYPFVDKSLAREWYATHKNGVSADGSLKEYSPYYTGLMKTYKVKENIAAGYAMATLNLGEAIRIIGGVRIEKENDDYTAKYAPEISNFYTYDPATISDTTTHYSHTYILPDIHLRIKPADWFDVRLAVTKTLARPDFTMRLPKIVVDRINKTIYRGNPSLNNTEAWNYDVIASFYKSEYGLFTVGGFYKKMDNVFYMLSDVNIIDPDMASSFNLPQGYGSYVGFKLNEPRNSNNTTLKGLEFDLQANLKFLPGFLANFILRGNLSLIQSVTYVPRFIAVIDESVFPPVSTPLFYDSKETLEGQPSKFGNVALGYDQGGFSGRLSVFFQGDYGESVSSNNLLDVMQKGYSKWDLSLKQSIKKYNMDIMLNLTNISNMEEGSFNGHQDHDKGSSIYGMLVDLGLRITL